MSTISENSDGRLLELLRCSGPLSIAEIAEASGVTATAVRQRLGRLMGQQLVTRSIERSGRGRPRHTYALSDKARRQAGTNFADLARVLWQEILAEDDVKLRQRLLDRVARSLARQYGNRIHGATAAEKMRSIRQLFEERDVPFVVQEGSELPILQACDCPYPELAEHDRTICDVERQVLSRLLDEDVHLSQCRLDGAGCCEFEVSR